MAPPPVPRVKKWSHKLCVLQVWNEKTEENIARLSASADSVRQQLARSSAMQEHIIGQQERQEELALDVLHSFDLLAHSVQAHEQALHQAFLEFNVHI